MRRNSITIWRVFICLAIVYLFSGDHFITIFDAQILNQNLPFLSSVCYIKNEYDTCLFGFSTRNRDTAMLCSGPMANLTCNNSVRSIVKTTPCKGRLGNVMAAYATLLFFYRLGYNAILTAEQSEIMNIVFDPEAFDIKLGIIDETYQLTDVENVRGAMVEDTSFTFTDLANNLSLTQNKILDLGAHPGTFKSFKTIWDDVLQQFKFRNEILEDATQILMLATKSFRSKHSNCTVLTVGLHSRRTDYIGATSLVSREVFDGDVMRNFFLFCMQKYRKKYNVGNVRVVFVMLSDDPAWLRDNFADVEDAAFLPNTTTLPENQLPGRDLAIFSLCDHAIRSWGTYGLWGSLLAGGDMLYPISSPNSTMSISNETKWMCTLGGEGVDINQFLPKKTNQPTHILPKTEKH